MSTSVPMAVNELARRSEGAIDVRVDPMRVRLDLSALQSKDHHDLRCMFDCSVRVAENASDRRLLGEVLLADRTALKREDVAAHISHHVRSRIESFLHERPAIDVLSGSARDELLSSIRAAADAAAFACGLIVLPPYQLDVQSSSVQRERIEQMQRTRAEERSADQVEHLRRAGELLKQFQSVRESSNNFSPGQILQQIAPADRGSTLEALLAVSSQQDDRSMLFAVAGPYLVRIDPRNASPAPALTPLPSTLGPLRSVQPANVDGRSHLLIGAQNGVMLVDPDAPQNVKLFAVGANESSRNSQLGFNRVVLDESTRTIWASHFDYGLIAWSLDSAEQVAVVGDTAGARNVQVLSPGAVVCSIGPTLMSAGLGAGAAPAMRGATASAIVAILHDALRGWVVRDNGTIDVIDTATREATAREQRSSGIAAAAALPWLGSIRLLLACDDGAIECVGVDDQLVTQYLSAHRGYKTLAANASVVAAVSSDRQRLILWHTWDGRKPFAELHLTSQTRHRIADIDFG